MFKKLKELLKATNKKIKEFDKKHLKPLFDNFNDKWSKMKFDSKILIVLFLILSIDFSFFASDVARYKNEPAYKILKELKTNVNDQKTKIDKLDNDSKEKVVVTENNDTQIINNIVNDYKIISESLQVYFVDEEKTKNVTIYIKNKDNNISQYLNIPKFSIIQNLEPLLLKKNVPFSWITIPKKPIFPIVNFISSNIFMIMFVGFMLFLVAQTADISFGSKSFDIVKPKDIKGSIKDIIGYQDVKDEILQLKELISKKNKYKLYGIEEAFNYLLTGKAGTGKSKMAGYICKILNIPMLVTTGNVDSKYVGSGVKHIRQLFKEAYKLALNDPSKSCIIFIDEGESLMMQRGKSDNKWADDSTKELLAHLDGVKTNKEINIIVIVASNFNENNFEMDDAMMRRFKKKIHFRDPNLEERRDIIKYYLKKVKSKVRNIDIDFIAKNTSGLTPAIIETIIQEAGLIALKNKEKVNTDNIMKAFENVLIGQSNRKTTSDKDAIRKVIALHEMGHFIVDFDKYMQINNKDINKTKENIKLLKVSSEAISRSNALGYVLSEQEDMLLKSVEELENDIKSLYGGVAAEEVFYGKSGITTGSANDIEKVTKILNHLVFETGSYVDYKINFSQLKLKDNDSEKLIKDKSIALYKETYDTVSSHKDLIKYLSDILLDKWVLTKDEIFEEIHKFYNKEV